MTVRSKFSFAKQSSKRNYHIQLMAELGYFDEKVVSEPIKLNGGCLLYQLPIQKTVNTNNASFSSNTRSDD
ncbi:MAG: hypothetical protein ACJAW1_003387 [Glaciecola sp.]|jgi:hypothetical protein